MSPRRKQFGLVNKCTYLSLAGISLCGVIFSTLFFEVFRQLPAETLLNTLLKSSPATELRANTVANASAKRLLFEPWTPAPRTAVEKALYSAVCVESTSDSECLQSFPTTVDGSTVLKADALWEACEFAKGSAPEFWVGQSLVNVSALMVMQMRRGRIEPLIPKQLLDSHRLYETVDENTKKHTPSLKIVKRVSAMRDSVLSSWIAQVADSGTVALNWSLTYGSVLAALRDGHYIPFDHDVDVYLANDSIAPLYVLCRANRHWCVFNTDIPEIPERFRPFPLHTFANAKWLLQNSSDLQLLEFVLGFYRKHPLLIVNDWRNAQRPLNNRTHVSCSGKVSNGYSGDCDCGGLLARYLRPEYRGDLADHYLDDTQIDRWQQHLSTRNYVDMYLYFAQRKRSNVALKYKRNATGELVMATTTVVPESNSLPNTTSKNAKVQMETEKSNEAVTGDVEAAVSVESAEMEEESTEYYSFDDYFESEEGPEFLESESYPLLFKERAAHRLVGCGSDSHSDYNLDALQFVTCDEAAIDLSQPFDFAVLYCRIGNVRNAKCPSNWFEILDFYYDSRFLNPKYTHG